MTQPHFIQNVAFGSRDIQLSNHDSIKVPALQRRRLRIRMWELYEKEHTDNNGDYSGVSRSVYLAATNIATATDQKSLAALDNHAVRYGTENFQHVRDLLNRISGFAPAHATSQSLRTRVGGTFMTIVVHSKR